MTDEGRFGPNLSPEATGEPQRVPWTWPAVPAPQGVLPPPSALLPPPSALLSPPSALQQLLVLGLLDWVHNEPHLVPGGVNSRSGTNMSRCFSCFNLH